MRATKGPFWRRPALRRFLRDPWAVFSSLVVACYLLIALSIALFGWIRPEEASARVGPGQLTGFLETPSRERRIHTLEEHLNPIVKALEHRDPVARLNDIDYLGRRVVTTEPEQLSKRVASLTVRLDRLFEELEAEHPAHTYPDLIALENDVAQLYRDPDGAAGLYYKLALALGTDAHGSSIALKAIYTIKVAIQVGLVAAILAMFIAALLGGVAGYFGGWIDQVVVWLIATFSGLPYIVLLLILASLFLHSEHEGTLIPVYVALCATLWVGPCRVIRGEVIKLRGMDYVHAAVSMGLPRLHVLWRHVLPNATHLLLIHFGLVFVAAVKAEVILSFLNLGVRDEPSWGVMIHDSRQQVLAGFYWQIGAAALFMSLLVLAFHRLIDALQDALDPRSVAS